MLYHCLRRRPNNKTILSRRFVFDRVTSVILILSNLALKTRPILVRPEQEWDLKHARRSEHTVNNTL